MSSRRFVRVVQRQGWDLELVDEGRRLNFPSREDALREAEALTPDWIEVGEVVAAVGELPQHHRWRTLRRAPSGDYLESGLSWGGPA